MKSSRSFSDSGNPMGTTSLPALPQRVSILQHSRNVVAPSNSLPHASLSLASSEACPSTEFQRGAAASEHAREAPSECASSRENLAVEVQGEPDGSMARNLKESESMGNGPKHPDLTVVHRVGTSGRISLKDVVYEPIGLIAQRMHDQPDELLEDLKSEIRDIIAGTTHQKEDFALLQKLLLSRSDLSPDVLARANRTQLEILVAIKTGIQAFLHPSVSMPQSVLIEVFFHKRCRNMACQNQLPGDECTCDVCTTKNGFCNACMCTICSKFDFDVNTCRWIGCDSCSHWTHTDCAIRSGQIRMGSSSTGPSGATELLFLCKACKRTSELLGWVKDVFHTCAVDWEKEDLLKEFDAVRRIFHGSEDPKGKRLFWKAEELLEKLKAGADSNSVCKEIQRFFQALEAEDAKVLEGDAMKMIEPQEACSRIAEVLQEAITKMEAVAEDRSRALKKARLSLEACDQELEEKKREFAALQLERQHRKQEIDELETIVRLKQAEADMFQVRADEARREAEKFQRMAAAKAEKIEEEYTNRYLKLRLNEVEAERRSLFEKQLQEYSRLQGDPHKIEDMLKRVCSKTDLLSQSDLGTPS